MQEKTLSPYISFIAIPLITAVCVILLCSAVFAIKKTYFSKKIKTYITEILRDEIVFNSKAEVLVDMLKVSSAYDSKGAIILSRVGRANDGGYITSDKALKTADVLLGYGIATDQSFEEEFSSKYNKRSYGFDCGLSGVSSTSKLFTFVNECIGTDKFLYTRNSSSQKITSFSTQLKNLNLTDKKIFIKMDIEGAEYEAFDDIHKHHANITGIVLELHVYNTEILDKAITLLRELDKNFVLIHVHGNNAASKFSFMTNNSSGRIPKVVELSYIHKSLVTTYKLSSDQKHPTELDMPNLADKEDMKFEIW